MKDTLLMRFQVFRDKFMSELDPYKVVDCDMDGFSPYTYINENKFRQHFPGLYKEYKEIEELDTSLIEELNNDYLFHIIK